MLKAERLSCPCERKSTSEALEGAGKEDGVPHKDSTLLNKRPVLQFCKMKILHNLEVCYSTLIKTVVPGHNTLVSVLFL